MNPIKRLRLSSDESSRESSSSLESAFEATFAEGLGDAWSGILEAARTPPENSLEDSNRPKKPEPPTTPQPAEREIGSSLSTQIPSAPQLPETIFAVPCPANHKNSRYSFHMMQDFKYILVCDCKLSTKLVGYKPFKDMDLSEIANAKDNVDFRPHRLVYLFEMFFHGDPTIPVEPFSPIPLQPHEKLPFRINPTFQVCPNNHENKEVCLIDQEYQQTILVCQCKDKILQMRQIPFTNDLLEEFEQDQVYMYYKPESRGYKAIPISTWAKKL